MNYEPIKKKAEFVLIGEMPSKKNAWKRGANGQVFVPREMNKVIDDFIWQIKGTKIRPRSPIQGPIEVSFLFVTKVASKLDLDNMTTTALDILQKAQVIENDKNVVQLFAQKEVGSESKVFIIIN